MVDHFLMIILFLISWFIMEEKMIEDLNIPSMGKSSRTFDTFLWYNFWYIWYNFRYISLRLGSPFRERYNCIFTIHNCTTIGPKLPINQMAWQRLVSLFNWLPKLHPFKVLLPRVLRHLVTVIIRIVIVEKEQLLKSIINWRAFWIWLKRSSSKVTKCSLCSLSLLTLFLSIFSLSFLVSLYLSFSRHSSNSVEFFSLVSSNVSIVSKQDYHQKYTSYNWINYFHHQINT